MTAFSRRLLPGQAYDPRHARPKVRGREAPTSVRFFWDIHGRPFMRRSLHGSFPADPRYVARHGHAEQQLVTAAEGDRTVEAPPRAWFGPADVDDVDQVAAVDVIAGDDGYAVVSHLRHSRAAADAGYEYARE